MYPAAWCSSSPQSIALQLPRCTAGESAFLSRFSYQNGAFIVDTSVFCAPRQQQQQQRKKVQRSLIRAEVSTVLKRASGGGAQKKPTMIVDAITVQKGKYGYEIESCINSLSLLPPRGSVTKCMESYKTKLTMQDFAVIFREFAQRGDWHRALRLFKYMQRQQWCKPTEHIYTIMIGIMGREGLLEKCAEIFEDMPNNDVKWNVYAFTALINAYGRNGHYDASLHLLARMKEENVEPNLITYNTVLNACAKGGLDWEGLLNIFAQMRHEGIQPDIITYNTLLSACNNRKLPQHAGTVFKTMNESGVLPDDDTYKSLVSTYENAGELGKVEELYREMQEEGNVPDVSGYNVLIEAYTGGGNVQKAAAVFKQMQKAGCAPNLSTYSILLDAYGKQGSFEEVRSLFADMKALDTSPDVETYNTLISVFGAGGYFKEAVVLFEDMIDSEVQPNEATYIRLLDVCGKTGLTKEAAQIHRHMLSKSTPNLEATGGLIRSYGKMAMYSNVLICYYAIKEAGLTPDGSIYDAMIEGYAKGGLYVEAGSTFYAKFTAGFRASLSTFNSMIEAYSKAGMYADAIQFFDDMQRAECPPDEKTHLALLNTYCAMGSFDEAKAEFLEMKELTGVPEASAYCLLLSICARRSKWEYAGQLLEEMQRADMPSLHIVVADLLQGRYDKDYNWQIVEHAFDGLKMVDLGESMTFYNALLEVLVCFGQIARAAKVLQATLQRGAYPEAFKRTKTVWSLDIHRMSAGAGVTALLVWLGELHSVASSRQELPYMAAIVISWGDIEKNRQVQDLPLAKVLISVLQGLNSPFGAAAWNEGRLVAKGEALKEWLLDLGACDKIKLVDAPLPRAMPTSRSQEEALVG